jgi:ABC transporter substrate binding protein (PQQ-dependent alcohol dehydrogenase system)
MIEWRQSLAAALIYFIAIPASAQSELSILYLGRTVDDLYKSRRAYTGLSLRDIKRPLEGARLAVRDSRILARAIGIKVVLEERLIEPSADLMSIVDEEIADGGRIVLADLNRSELDKLIAKTSRRDDVIIFNFRHEDDELRDAKCAEQLFHTLPSRAMLSDAMAQFLSAKGWRRVLMLVGEAERDGLIAKAFLASAKKFGLQMADSKPFILSNDPRQREKNNLVLLSADASYDVVFLADSLGEVGRYATYGIALPRPVVGSEGLSSRAWHWTLERYGAPQLNQRFAKRAKRRIAEHDWAAWAAVRSVVEAVRQTKNTSISEVRTALLSEMFKLDAYKGFPASYRPWSRQLRQPILLATHNATIGLAPFKGFEHQFNVLDTLGSDKRETRCRR